MKKAILALTIILIPLVAYAGQYSHPKSNVSSSAATRAAKEAVEVYNGPTAPRPFVIIGEVHAKGSTEKMLISKMRSAALNNGADAILMYKIEAGTFPSMWTGAVLSNAKGIAVRWAKDGEKGITKITDDISIPVIQ